MKVGLLPFNPRLVINALLVLEIKPISPSYPLTPLESSSLLLLILSKSIEALKTPGYINDIQRILKL